MRKVPLLFKYILEQYLKYSRDLINVLPSLFLSYVFADGEHSSYNVYFESFKLVENSDTFC